MAKVHFSFSDTIAGYVTHFDGDQHTYGVKTSGGEEFQIKLRGNTYAQLARNLSEPYQDCTAQMREMLSPGRVVFSYGTYYTTGWRSCAGDRSVPMLRSGASEWDLRWFWPLCSSRLGTTWREFSHRGSSGANSAKKLRNS
jgi:hypothetical protein